MNKARGWIADRGTPFYRAAAWSALAIAFAGFLSTYTLPMLRGAFEGPRWAHLHGAVLLGWLVLVIAQTHLAGRRVRIHRRLGWAALILAPWIAVSTVAIGVEATRRDLASGIATGMAGNVTAPLVFCGLVGAALLLRGQTQWHKRLMVIATVVMLWPAWFRWRHFLPWVPRPEIALGLVATNLAIVLAMIRDRVRFGAIHPAYLWVGLPVIAWQVVETLAFGSSWWSAFGLGLYRLLA